MLVPWHALNRINLYTAQCAKGAERKRRRMSEEDMWESLERVFQVYREMLETMLLFQHMGTVLTAGDDNCLAVSDNLRKATKIWVRMTRFLIRERADPKVLGLFFKAVVQAVFLSGTDTWFLTP